MINILNGTEECPGGRSRSLPRRYLPPALAALAPGTPPRGAPIAPATPPCPCLEALALSARSLLGARRCAPSSLRSPSLPPRRSFLAAPPSPAVRRRRTVVTKPRRALWARLSHPRPPRPRPALLHLECRPNIRLTCRLNLIRHTYHLC